MKYQVGDLIRYHGASIPYVGLVSFIGKGGFDIEWVSKDRPFWTRLNIAFVESNPTLFERLS